jgi:hypothetical protein
VTRSSSGSLSFRSTLPVAVPVAADAKSLFAVGASLPTTAAMVAGLRMVPSPNSIDSIRDASSKNQPESSRLSPVALIVTATSSPMRARLTSLTVRPPVSSTRSKPPVS